MKSDIKENFKKIINNQSIDLYLYQAKPVAINQEKKNNKKQQEKRTTSPVSILFQNKTERIETVMKFIKKQDVCEKNNSEDWCRTGCLSC